VIEWFEEKSEVEENVTEENFFRFRTRLPEL